MSLLILLVAGCAREEDYLKVMRDKREAMHEVANVLEGITDEKTMADAKASLDRLQAKFELIAERAKALPAPPPRKVQERMEQDRHFNERAFERLRSEVGRVSKLPGGAQFWKQFESGSPGLFPAGLP
jgi:hypothetical protein